MDTKLQEHITKKFKKIKHPDVHVGDIVEVHTKIKEGGKERIQVFKGMIIGIKGSGMSKTITVRKITYGIGVEKIFPLFAPTIKKIKIVKRSKVRKSKLYFLRKRVGKEALKAGFQIPVEGEDWETQYEEEMQEQKEEQNTETEEGKETDGKKDTQKDKNEDKKKSDDVVEEKSSEKNKKEKEK